MRLSGSNATVGAIVLSSLILLAALVVIAGLEIALPLG